jgi:dihydrofolate synthase / folylpolyglutamate synthase
MSAYASSLRALFGLTRFGEKLSLDGPRALHEFLGRPLDGYGSVLIGGTNGKGSTAAFLETALRQCGLKTGLFTSPHLNGFTERIRVSGEPINREWLSDETQRIIPWASTNGASFFEATWGLAARYFAEMNVDIAVWEVGLGGRLDATNVAEPLVSGITSIALDHTHILGATLEAIAKEKAGIFRPQRPALTGATGAGLVALSRVCDRPLTVTQPVDKGTWLPLGGQHQRENAGLALAMARELGHAVNPAHLVTTTWPGRCERIGRFILDTAHNPHALGALHQWLTEEQLAPIDVVFGVMEGKDTAQMASIVSRFARQVHLVTPDYPRRLEAGEVSRFFGKPVSMSTSLEQILAEESSDRPTLICGSSFLVGEARARLLGFDYPECGIRTIAR